MFLPDVVEVSCRCSGWCTWSSLQLKSSSVITGNYVVPCAVW